MKFSPWMAAVGVALLALLGSIYVVSEGQSAKLAESFDQLERDESFDELVHIGHIGLATALAWLEFRNLPDFRTGRPRLTRWYEAFSVRPSMQATTYRGETQDGPVAQAIAG